MSVIIMKLQEEKEEEEEVCFVKSIFHENLLFT